jgi:hypothetical protein
MSEKESPWAKVGGTSENYPTWNPGKGIPRHETAESRKNAYLIGHFIGKKEGIGKYNSTIYNIKLEKVGNEKDLDGPASEGDTVEVWGSGALDYKMREISVGEKIMIKWEGKKQKEDSNDNPFHAYEVFRDTKSEPIAVSESVPENQAADMDEDDDLPF